MDLDSIAACCPDDYNPHEVGLPDTSVDTIIGISHTVQHPDGSTTSLTHDNNLTIIKYRYPDGTEVSEEHPGPPQGTWLLTRPDATAPS
jgi:hypothetical protein